MEGGREGEAEFPTLYWLVEMCHISTARKAVSQDAEGRRKLVFCIVA